MVELNVLFSERDYYMSEFETEVKEDVLMIGNISLEEIQAEEQRLREEHVKYQSQEATLHARYSPLIPPSLHRLPPMQYRCPSSSPKRDLFSARPPFTAGSPNATCQVTL